MDSTGVTSTRPLRQFLQDFRWGIRTWRTEPSLPVIVGLVFAAVTYSIYIPLIVLWLLFPLRLAAIGFHAVPWGFYLRASEGRTLPWNEMPGVIWRYFRRFFRLGLVVLFFAAVPLVLIAVVAVHGRRHGESIAAHLPLWYWFAAALVSVAIDATLTFVSPALVYSTDRVSEAFGYGFRYIREIWPSSAIYVLTPGITLVVIGISLPASFVGVGGKVAFAGLAAVIGFAFKGAIAACYLRGHQDRMDRLSLITSFFAGETTRGGD
jgi:hypothetical protein